MVQTFLSYLQHEKNYSLHTVEAYRGDLDQLCAFLSKNFEMELNAATFQALRTWMVTQMNDGVSPSSIRRKVSALKSYYKWYKRSHQDFVDPTVKLVLPKMQKRLPEFVDESSLFTTPLSDISADSFEASRDLAIIELFYHTGIRSAELREIKMDSFRQSSSELKVFGKRNKERIVPLSKGMRSLMENYLEERSKLEEIHDVDHFFITQKGKKLYPKLVYRIVNDYLSKVSSVKKKSPHVLRHTFATHMLNKGADINAIKELLGHSSLAATQVYTHNSVDQLLKVYKSAHPKS
jgi:integrase/recombinase XerC